MKQNLSYQNWTWQLNYRRVPRAATKLLGPLILMIRSAKTSLMVIAIYLEKLVQTLLSLVLASSTSVSSYSLCLVDSEFLVRLLSSILSDYHTLSDPSSVWFPQLLGRDLMEISHLESLCIISACGSLPMTPFAVRKSLWWWLDKSLIYECSKILGVISLYLWTSGV